MKGERVGGERGVLFFPPRGGRFKPGIADYNKNTPQTFLETLFKSAVTKVQKMSQNDLIQAARMTVLYKSLHRLDNYIYLLKFAAVESGPISRSN